MSEKPRLPSARVASCRSPAASRDGVRLEQHRGVARIALETSRVPMLTSACARVLSSPSRVASSSARSPQSIASLGVLGEHRELREPAVGARELDRLAERLEDRDRLDAPSPARGSPSPAYQWNRDRTRVQRPTAASSPSSRVDRDRALDRRRTRRRGGRRRRRPSRAPRARPPARAAGAGRRSPRRGGSASTPRGSTRAPPRAARRRARSRRRRSRAPAASAWWTMSAGSASAASRAVEDLAVQPPSRGDREARPDRVARQLVAEADVRRHRPRAAAGAPAPPPPRPSRASRRRAATCARGSARPRRARPARRGVVVEPRRPPEHGVRDRRRQLVRRSASASSSVT